MSITKKRILTGDRPTGKLHLGHYIGTLENRVRLQDEYETFIMVADVQALTDNFANPEKVRDSVYQVALDNLSVGLDPKKSVLFVQSQIPELAELTVYFMNLISLSRLKRNPTVKAEMQQKGFGSNVPVGFVNYPLSEAADILSFKADLVPTGDDQAPMVELTREVVNKFNTIYEPIFTMPEILVGRVARLVGTDGGAKMSKSLGNVIYLSDCKDDVERKVMKMYTDPNRKRATDPGTIEGNPVFAYLDAFGTDSESIASYKIRYQNGKVGDIEVKQYLAKILNNFLEPIRASREKYEAQPELVHKILEEGNQRAQQIIKETMRDVRRAMKLYGS